MIDGVISKVKQMIGKAIVNAITDSGQIQMVKVSALENEVLEVERVQNYGLTSNPPKGSEAVVLFVGGARDSGIAVSVDCGEFRVSGLESGEVCVYSKFGQKILLKKNGKIVFNDGTDFAVSFTDLKSGFDALKTSFNAHVHTAPVGGGATTAPTVPATASIDAAKIAGILVP